MPAPRHHQVVDQTQRVTLRLDLCTSPNSAIQQIQKKPGSDLRMLAPDGGSVRGRSALIRYRRLTCSTGERRTRASGAPHQVCAPLLFQCTMAQRSATQSASNEADIQLAFTSIKTKKIQSTRRAAAIYSVPETTLRRRRASVPARRDCQPNSKKLT
jgi:hypothetical protein